MRDPGEYELTEDDGHGIRRGIIHYPISMGFLCGILGFFAILLMLPTAPPAPVSAVDVAAMPAAQTAPQAAAQATPGAAPVTPASEAQTAPQGTPSLPAVPIVAEAAIIVTDTGLNRRVAETIDKALPREATLAISAYATDVAATAAAFKTSGRDVWLQIASQSMEAGIDPGPLAVASSISTSDNMASLKRQIGLASGSIVGIYVPDDADITIDTDMWRDLATNIIGDNLMVLDATSAKVATTLYMQKSEAQISAYLKADIIVDGDKGPEALQNALESALPTLLKKQQAIMVLNNPTVLAVQTLGTWINGLAAKGIRLVPASQFTGLKP